MRRVSLAAAVVLASAGCGGREFAEVAGRVTLDGKPLADVEVVFLPDSLKGNHANTASAVTDADGRYQLYTPRDNRAGTVLGAHRVVVIDLTMVADAAGAGGPPRPGQAAAALPGTKPRRFPTAYGSAGETPFRDVDVTPGRQTLDFDLKADGPRRAP